MMPTRKPNTTLDGGVACAFGEPWLGPHFICQAATAAICGVPVSEVELSDWSHLLPKLLTAGSQIGPETADDAAGATIGGQRMLF